MKPNIDGAAAHKELSEAYRNLRDERATAQYKTFAAWIDALIVQVQAQMADCPADKLAAVQVRLQQLIALRGALLSPGGASTGFIC